MFDLFFNFKIELFIKFKSVANREKKNKILMSINSFYIKHDRMISQQCSKKSSESNSLLND